jgi:hypothetical protein
MGDNTSKKWNRLSSPPPPLFFGPKERDLTKQVADEITERVVGQQILYYAIDLEKSNFHDLYGESMEKTFLPPVYINAFVTWDGYETKTSQYGIDKRPKIKINFHKRRLVEDQDLFVRCGDFVQYGDSLYEIVVLNEPREMFGQTQHKVEISADCVYSRAAVFDGQ